MSKKITKEQVQEILDRTDWQKYWDDVNEAATKEIEALEIAAVKSKRNWGKVLV